MENGKTEFLNAQAIILHETYWTINMVPFATQWRPLDPIDCVNNELQCIQWTMFKTPVHFRDPIVTFVATRGPILFSGVHSTD